MTEIDVAFRRPSGQIQKQYLH